MMILVILAVMVLGVVSLLVKLIKMFLLPKAKQRLGEDWSIYEKRMKRVGVTKNEKKQRIGCCCKSRKNIRFKPKLRKKESTKEPKLVYMAYITQSTTAVLFSNLYHTSKSKTTPQVAATPTRLFDMKLPEEKERIYLNAPLYCKGLFALPTANNILVCNPATKEVITLPQSCSKHVPRPYLLESGEGLNIRVGFGFVQSTQAYKVAQFFYRSYNLKRKRYSMGFEVFTIGVSSCWRVLAKDPPYPMQYSCSNFTGKCIYFHICHLLHPNAPNAFLCFNLRNENFSLLYPPISLSHVHVVNMKLTNLQGCLCLSLLSTNNTKLSLFTSKQGNNLDWTPTFCFNVALPPRYVSVRPLVEQGGQLLIRFSDLEKQWLVIYDTNNNAFPQDVNGQFEDVNMQQEGFKLFLQKPWFHVSSYEETLFQLRS